MKKKWNERVPWWGIRFRKIVQIMKWTFMLLFISCMHLSAAVYSQQERMDISVKDISVEQLIKTIKSKMEVDFLYNIKEIERNGTVSLNMKDATVEDILQEAFRGKALTYVCVNGVFIIRPMDVVAKDSVKKMYDLKGQVFDTKKQPLPGVTVRLDGTTVGTAADSEGKFVLRVPEKKGILIFTFVGFKQKRVTFSDDKPMVVTLEEDVEDLDEVVVRAYGTQNKREVISAISSIKADEMKELPTASLVNMLQGRLAGVNIINQSGAPGSASVVAIRGFNSLLTDGASDGQPLYVIDGVPMHSFVSPVTGTNTMADIDPSMIESVEVLKDAAAASIYGSRAGNGVILITTKRGRDGEAKFAVNLSYSASNLMAYPLQTGGRLERWLDIQEMRNTIGSAYVSKYGGRIYPDSYDLIYNLNSGGVYDAFWGTGRTKTSVIDRLQDSLNPFYNNQTNWWKYAFRTGEIVNANLQASGGSQKFLYMIGAGYYSEKGIMLNSNYQRINVLSNLSATPNERLRLDMRLYGAYMDRSINTAMGLSHNRYEGMTVEPTTQSTLLPAGELEMQDWMEDMNKVTTKSDDYRAMGSLYLEYNLFKGLTFSAKGSIDYSQSNKNEFKPSDLDRSRGENRSEGDISRTIALSNEELLRYKLSLKEKHNLEVLLGFNVEKNQVHTIGGWGKGNASDFVYYYNPDLSDDVKDYGGVTPDWRATRSYHSSFIEKSMVSYFGRLSYNYKQRYLVEATFRRDGSSTFGEDNKWANFPSVAAGWAFSEERFLKNVTWLDWGKVRASYGTSGQVFSDPYLAHGLMRVEKGPFMGMGGVAAGAAISPDLTWEKSEQYNLGLDLDMFDYRLKVKFDYYYKLTSSLIYAVQLPATVLIADSRIENAMDVSNEGIELELEGDILRSGPISWRMKLNVSRNWNRFEKSYNDKDAKNLVIGRSLYGMYCYASEGFYNSDDEVPVYYDYSGNKKYFGNIAYKSPMSGLVGAYKFKDLNGDNMITTADKYYVGSPLPKAYGGWVNEVKWKCFDLNVLFNFTLGRKMINQKEYLVKSGPKFVDVESLHFWGYPGDDDADLAKIGLVQEAMVDTHVERVHSISLKQLTLGCDLPKNWAKKIALNGARLFLTAENLFYLSNYSGDNPEIVDVYTGVDHGRFYPLPRKYSVGLTLNF